MNIYFGVNIVVDVGDRLVNKIKFLFYKVYSLVIFVILFGYYKFRKVRDCRFKFLSIFWWKLKIILFRCFIFYIYNFNFNVLKILENDLIVYYFYFVSFFCIFYRFVLLVYIVVYFYFGFIFFREVFYLLFFFWLLFSLYFFSFGVCIRGTMLWFYRGVVLVYRSYWVLG